jgi:hypothetical protein
MKSVLYLEASDKGGDRPAGASVECPVWSHIEMRIERAFKHGGYVMLSSAIHHDDDTLELGTFLAMESHIGEYRLVYTLATQPWEKPNRREWWEPGDAPFRGIAVFNDHEWDDRTVCRDLSVAVQMFRDFFDHGELSESSLSQTRSTSDRKPR